MPYYFGNLLEEENSSSVTKHRQVGCTSESKACVQKIEIELSRVIFADIF